MLGGAALALPLERALGEPLTRRPDRRSALPAPFTVPFTVPPVIDPVRSTRRHRHSTPHHESSQPAEIIPGYQTPIWGYNGITPGPTIVEPRPEGGRPAGQPAPGRHPDAAATRRGPRSTCTGRRRCRSTTATPATSPRPGRRRTTTTRTSSPPGRSGTTTTACTTPRRTPTSGLAAHVPPARPVERALHPAGRVRRPAHRHGHDVRSRRASCMFDDNGASGLWGDVILVNGRPWPVMKVSGASTVSASSTRRCPGPTGSQLEHGRADHGRSPPTAV